MKKLLAVLLAVVMLFSVATICSSAEETAKVTIVTNKGSAVNADVSTYFTVKFANFGEIQGADVTITADQNITLEDINVTGFPAANEGNNYSKTTVDGVTTVRFVDLTNGASGKITFKATVPSPAPAEDPIIKVVGKYAQNSTTLFEVAAPADGIFELTKVIAATKTGETAAGQEVAVDFDGTKKFVPQGAVYVNNGNDTYSFAEKQTNGTFKATAAGNYEYKVYDIPANKIATFGVSDDPEDKTKLRFGNYSALNAADVEHGTLVFEGNWLALKNLYIQNGFTVQELVKAFYEAVTAKLAANPSATHVTYTVGSDKINVYRFKQTRYMWKDDTNGILEYAIRLRNVQEKTTYTGVAFSVANDGTVTMANDVKYITRPAAN